MCKLSTSIATCSLLDPDSPTASTLQAATLGIRLLQEKHAISLVAWMLGLCKTLTRFGQDVTTLSAQVIDILSYLN